MARLRTPAASLQCNNLTMFQLYLQKTQESIIQQLISELELEILALAQEINVARLLLGLAEHGPQLAIWDTNMDLGWTQSSLVHATSNP